MSLDASSAGAEARPRWPFGWAALLALAWLLFELTHQPGLAAALVAMKFGTADFRTAWWLLRRDPARWRAAAAGCAYLAWGLRKAALVAFLMAAAFLSAAGLGGAPAPLDALWQGAVGTGLAALAGLAFAGALTGLAVSLAVAGNARLWVGDGARAACDADLWPPAAWPGEANRLGSLVMTSVATLLWLVAALIRVNRAFFGWEEVIFAAMLLPAALCVALCRDAVDARVGARSPADAWPPDESA